MATEFARYTARTLAPYVPTPQVVVQRAISMLRLRAGDVFVDLGCGDGRVALAAAEACSEAHAVGLESETATLNTARSLLNESCDRGGHRAAAAVEGLVGPANLELRAGDVLREDLTMATAFYTYMSPDGVQAIAERLEASSFPRGADLRFVSCDYRLPGGVWAQREVGAERAELMGLSLYLYRWTA
eukprot:g6641.t1